MRKIEAKGTYETAHRLRACIGSVFRYTVARSIADGPAPAPNSINYHS
ncbi:phage integrase central domain-containing protein [Sulfitobacter pacificus]